jgi:hypothetical protein
MRTRILTLCGAGLIGVVLCGCGSAARFAGLMPPTGPAAVEDSAPLTFRTVPSPAVQLGVDIDYYTYTGENVLADATSTIEYIKSLHANAVSVSFPVFETRPRSSAVRATDATPTPHDLAIVASVAEKAGLYVSIRPLMDQASLGGRSRTGWQPSDQAAWFASYQRFLLPYATMAERSDIPEIFTGAELTVFQDSPRWRGLDAALRRVYAGTLGYASNWGLPVSPASGGRGVTETVDAYPIMALPASASVSTLTAHWRAYDATLPRGIVLSEVGIAAADDAYRMPYDFTWPGVPLRPSIQTHWFAAICDAAARIHLGGIYFWNVGLGQPLDVPPGPSDQASWVDSPGARAISSCFRRSATLTR